MYSAQDPPDDRPDVSGVWRFADARGDVVLEPSPRRVRAVFGGEVVADSRRMRLLHERGRLPRYGFPRSDVRTELLEPEAEEGRDARKGRVRRETLSAGGRRAVGAATSYPETPEGVPDLSGLVFLRWDAMDDWYEEDERIRVHARDPYTRVDALESSRRVEVELGGVVVAESERPVLLFETGLPVRYYLPRLDVRWELLHRTPTETACPYKGVTSSYWTVEAGGEVAEDAAWCYDHPKPDVARIAGRVAFFNERVDLRVDGERRERPTTPWS